MYIPRSKRMQPQTFILMHDKAELPNNDARDKQSKCVIKRKRVKYSGTPFSTATNGPWKFGRINGAGLNFMTGLLKRESRNFCFYNTHSDLIAM